MTLSSYKISAYLAIVSGGSNFAVTAILKYAFTDLNLHRVQLEVLTNNTRARNLYKKCGFRDEGEKRQAIFKNGRYLDITVMGILKTEYTV